MEKTDLKEAFSRQYASYKVHTIQTSKLWKHLKGKSRKRTLQVYIFPVSDINCSVKDGRLLLASLQAMVSCTYVMLVLVFGQSFSIAKAEKDY